MEKVIFSIDFENNPHKLNIFNNHVADLERAGAMQGHVLPMLGSYVGKVEHSFICRRDDFDQHFRNSVYLKGQESILCVASGNKMEAGLEYLATGRIVDLGCMHEVCREEAMQAEAWSYRPDMGVYWIAKKGNPDDSYAKSVKRFRKAPVPPHVSQVVDLMPLAAE